MTNLSIGLSALRNSQYAMDVVSSNLANANNADYHRQNVHLESLPPNLYGRHQIGQGVSINYIERVRNLVTESSLTTTISDASRVEQSLIVERQIEAIFEPGDGSLNQRLDAFFGEITKLTSTPGESTQQRVVVDQADRLAKEFHQMSGQLFELQATIRRQVEQEVDALNGQMEKISELTAQIKVISVTQVPNHELDQRDKLVNEVAQVIDVSRNEHFGGGLSLAYGGTSIQQGATTVEFQSLTTEEGELQISFQNSDDPLSFEGGRLPALLELYNTTIPEYLDRLDELASGLIQQFDQIHATGVGSTGSFSLLNANRSVEDPSLPLNQAGAAFPIAAGDLHFSIIDPSGNRITESISIDPETQSLEDVATAISGIDNLTASVNPQTNKLQIVASGGHQFDFTGNLESQPDLTAYSGTSVPSFSGTYNGEVNETLSYQIEGSGDVGVSSNLFVNVFDEGGGLLTRLNIGNGYEAGTELEAIDGVSLAFSAGTVVNNDTFESERIATPDETGILSSLGLNSFFVGKDASTIAIDEDILDEPKNFAAGKTGEVADTFNLFNFIDLQSERGLSNNQLSFSDFLNQATTDIGVRVQTNTQLSVSITSLQVRYEQERASISGVDLNEELVYLQQFQKSYEAAVRVIQTAESMLDELFRVVG